MEWRARRATSSDVSPCPTVVSRGSFGVCSAKQCLFINLVSGNVCREQLGFPERSLFRSVAWGDCACQWNRGKKGIPFDAQPCVAKVGGSLAPLMRTRALLTCAYSEPGSSDQSTWNLRNVRFRLRASDSNPGIRPAEMTGARCPFRRAEISFIPRGVSAEGESPTSNFRTADW